MKKLWVGKTIPIAPITTHTMAFTNDQLPFPTLPPPPPLPALPPVLLLPSDRDISSGQKIHAPGDGAPIGNTVASNHKCFLTTITTTTTTITTTITTTTTTTTTATSPTTAPTTVASTATPEEDLAEAERRNQDMFGDTKRYKLGGWGKHRHCRGGGR